MRDTTRLERVSMAVKGDLAELRLAAAHITITKRNGATRDEATSVTVPIDQIRGATVERPSRGQRGWFHLAVVGGSVPPPTELAASADPYTFPITGRDLAAARRVARLITDHVRKRGLPAESQADQLRSSSGVTISPRPPRRPSDTPSRGSSRAASTPAPPPSGAAPPRSSPPADTTHDDVGAPDLHLCELADLHRAGVLTDEEYERAWVRVTERVASPDGRAMDHADGSDARGRA